MVICGLMASKLPVSLKPSAPFGGHNGFAGLASSVPPTLIAPLQPRYVPAMEVRPLAPVPAPRREPAARDLTMRELDVLRGVAAGCSNKVIARQLCLTPETVKWHLKNIMRKLDVGTRQEAVLRAVEQGFLTGSTDHRA